jgi:hypothetical protein
MNKRNMLQNADEFDEFVHLSQKEIADDELWSEMMHFDGIQEYHDGEVPSAEEIATVEKVLKYASHCNYMGFTCADARLVMGCTTNVLKWSLDRENNDGGE